MATALTKTALAIDEIARRGSGRLVDIAAALGMPKSSAHRLLGALVSESILRRDELGWYTLGARLISWGAAAESTFDVRSVALSHMQVLHNELGETLNFHVPNGDHRVCIVALPGIYPLVPVIPLGRAMPLGRGSAGILLMAYASAEVQAEVAAMLTAAGLRCPTPVELEQARLQRWCVVSGELEPGLNAAAAAVMGTDSSVIGALTIGGSAGRLTPERLAELRPVLLHYADRIGLELTAAAPPRRVTIPSHERNATAATGPLDDR